ncbi:peptide/nickel transport system substrate-binding protein [Conexibacter arvalis]|uniref:Peptide/nickel transport system substrate-binding protein n=2 Tax=Conexibacter arvalis TaxID=912552 RepID=A0A840IAJ1_9ACTN|nr:peptide/nickel transport system substrate-binding protein [Conexibacter arvalis]
MAAMVAAGCGSSGGTGTGSGSGPAGTSILDVATTAAVTTWDPVKSFSTEVYYLANVYEPLLWANPPGAAERFRPGLAVSWRRSADAKTWTFRLRSGVTFHDGSPLTAAAVKQSILAVKDRGGASFLWSALDRIETPDEQTVVFRMSAPTEVDVAASSMYGAWIVAPRALAAAARDERWFERGRDAGTGPYSIAEYTPGKQVVLRAYPGYWGASENGGAFRTVNVQIAADAVAQQQMLQSGQVDIASSLPLENVAQFEHDDRFAVEVCESSLSYLGFFNTTRRPLDDPKVRRALALALPYDEIIDVGAEGFGTAARGPVPKGVFPYDEEIPASAQDLAEARRLLAEAGHPNGGFTLRLTYAAENDQQKQFAPLIKDALAKIGVKVTLSGKLFNQQWEEAKGDPRKAQDIFLLLYWPTASDAGSDNLATLFRSSERPFFNLSYWRSATYDRLVDEAIGLTATDRDGAQRLYTRAMRLLIDEAPGIYLYDVRRPVVVAKGLTGLECNPNYSFNLFFHELGTGAA